MTIFYVTFYLIPVVHELGKKIRHKTNDKSPSIVQDPLFFISLPALLNLKSEALNAAKNIDSGILLAIARRRAKVFALLFLVSGFLFFIVMLKI